MGSAVQLLNASATHIRAQSQIDAARVRQKASNEAAISLADSKKIVQAANNAASTQYANAQRKVQASNNTASTLVTDARRKVQSVYNDQAVLVNEAKKTLQAARNARAGTESSIALWAQSDDNRKLLDAAGKQIDAVSGEVLRSLDGAVRGRTFERLAHAENLGANLASAAAAGIASSGVTSFNQAMDMRQALNEEAQDRELSAKLYAAGQEKGNLLRDASNNMGDNAFAPNLDREVLIADQDYTPVFDEQDYSYIDDQQDYEVFTPNLDYTVYMDHKKPSGMGTVLSFAAAAAATYFGGPMAGAMVLDAATSAVQGVNDMDNGNMAGAQQQFGNVLSSGMGGAKAIRAQYGTQAKGQNTSWGSQIMSKAGASFKIGKG